MRWVAVFAILVPALAGATSEPLADEVPGVAMLQLRHTPPPSCSPYAPLEVVATVQTTLFDSMGVTLMFRQVGDSAGYYPRPMEPISSERYWTEVPARVVGDLGVEYYIEAKAGMARTRAGSPSEPFLVATAYSFRGDLPEELPGDDFLRELEELPTPERPATPVRERPGGVGVQVLLLLILGALGYLIYQRIGSN